MTINRSIILFMLILIFESTLAQQNENQDSLFTAREQYLLSKVSKKNNKVLSKVSNYYQKTNRTEKKNFDISFIGAPYYKSETSFGLGAIASGLYRTNKNDTITPLSDISIIGKGTLTGYYNFSVEGNHNANLDRIRIYYDILYSSFPQLYWGIGFYNGDNNETRTKFTKKTLHATIQPIFLLAPHFFAGPNITYDWIQGVNFESDSLLLGESPSSSTLNLGVVFRYDSRDITYNAQRGIYLNLEQNNYLHFGGNFPFFKTIGDFRSYTPLWKDAILAFRVYGEFSYGNYIPWTMKMVGYTNTNPILRSYYEGRYINDNMIAATIELRQRIWKRLGAVAWIGGGNYFSKVEPFDWKHTLSDLGLGLRWEFKKRINVRVDVGFGRCGQKSVVLGIKEAF